MRRLAVIGLTSWLIILPAGTALAQSGIPAKKLHDANCTQCHDAGMYTRPNRKMHSLDDVRKQVGACSRASGASLSAAEKEALVNYLNDNFYRFK